VAEDHLATRIIPLQETSWKAHGFTRR